jgi:hypothetical protein
MAGRFCSKARLRRDRQKPFTATMEVRTMIFSAQPNWFVVGHGDRHSDEGVTTHFFEAPIIAWRTEGTRLIPMTLGELDFKSVQDPDGYVTTPGEMRITRADYERRVTESRRAA